MDDEERAELNALRRRAYGPTAVPLDRDALQRLVELEELALPVAPTPLPLPAPAQDSVVSDSAPLAPAGGRRRMPRLHPAAAAAIVVGFAVIIGGVAAVGASQSQTAQPGLPDTPARLHVPVQIDDATGAYEDTAGVDVPIFPLGLQMSWIQSLGTYYGWSIWIGGGAFGGEDQNCLLLTDGSSTRARCATGTLRVDDSLAISLPYERIETADRPSGMTGDQHVDVTWGQGGFVTVARD